MAFNLEKFFKDVFNPMKGEVLTVMYDLPHGNISDRPAWEERRAMATEWHDTIAKFADKIGLIVNPIVTYEATGINGADLPQKGWMDAKEISLEKIITESSIIISMPEFSATAPLDTFGRKTKKLRAASMPGAAKFMEESGLSADYREISKKCRVIKPIFDEAIGAEVEFSTGHKCYFDLTDRKAGVDEGRIHQDVFDTEDCIQNLPSGEVFIVPNEKLDSKTAGELPHQVKDELVVYTVKNNKITSVKGDGPYAKEMKMKFEKDPGWRNIAEVAIGVNDKAKVTGNTLEDEKAGFHWAYGRSDHLGGTVGVKNFTSPSNVVHKDIIYAKGNPISCKKFEAIFPDNRQQTLIKDAVLLK